MDGPIETAQDHFLPLSEDEINAFFDDLDRDHDGSITFDELAAKLHHVHQELAPVPQKHHLHHPSRRDLETNLSPAGDDDALHAFLRADRNPWQRREDLAREVGAAGVSGARLAVEDGFVVAAEDGSAGGRGGEADGELRRGGRVAAWRCSRRRGRGG